MEIEKEMKTKESKKHALATPNVRNSTLPISDDKIGICNGNLFTLTLRQYEQLSRRQMRIAAFSIECILCNTHWSEQAEHWVHEYVR